MTRHATAFVLCSALSLGALPAAAQSDDAARRVLVQQADAAQRAGLHAQALAFGLEAGQLRWSPSLRMLVAQEHLALDHTLAALDAATYCVVEAEAERTLRALTGELVGPVLPGPATLTVKALRRGNAVSTWEAWLTQGDDVLARASAILGRARTTDRDGTELAPPPPAPPWTTLEPLPIGPPTGPHFARMYEFRTTGPYPFSARDRSEAAGWVRLRRPVPLGAPEILGLLDSFWPASFARESAPRPMATIAFTAELLADPAALSPTEPLRYRAAAVAARQGFVVELRELWTPQGELVALNQQTFVLIR
jgi:acyl-CoA thioesterase